MTDYIDATEQPQAMTTEPPTPSNLPATPETQGAQSTTDEDDAWLEGFADRATADAARKERTYSAPLLRAVLRMCAVFADKKGAEAHVYPDGTAFFRGDFAAIWIYSSALRGLDVKLPLSTKLRGDEVEVIRVGGGVELQSTGLTVKCELATASKAVAPAMPETAFRMLYRPDQAKDALAGKGNERLTVCRDESDPWRLYIDGHPVTLDRGAEPSTASFEGRAHRQHLAAVLGSTREPCFEQLEVCRKNASCGLITSVSQTFSGTKATVARFVALAPMRGAQP